MTRRSIGTAVVLVLAALAATPAVADPANVTVRVEGDADTLVARTAVMTTTATVNKDGTVGHDCTGTSAAGALQQATGGDWSGPWFDGFGYSVVTVRGETHAFGGDPVFWGFFVNDVFSVSAGVCGAELQTGDQVLLAPISEQSGASYAVLSLGGVPATVAPGQPFTVAVSRTTTDSSGDVTREAVADATVSGAGAGVTTNTGGTAQITLGVRGPAALRATHAGDIRSATEAVCVTDGADGACGSAVAAAAASSCLTTGDDGACGTKDRRPPRGKILSIREGQRFGRGEGPRTLSGIVAPDPSGLAAVRLRLTRNDGGRCATFDGPSERFTTLKRCGAVRGKWFNAGDREAWSYLLPARLGRARYVLDVQARDGAGNVDTLLPRTRTRVVFRVS
jgi:hypothetical protein